jgi:predicted amidohydrolase YtcJ
MIVPGLTDAHGHVANLGAGMETVDLRGATSIAEVIARCRASTQTGEVLVGRGWDQNLWPGAAMPPAGALDAAFPTRPVWLVRVDGHAGWGNAALLQRAGITAETAAPAGGMILRDDSGAATGVLVDAAMGLVTLPEPSDADVRRQLRLAHDRLLALGITGVHDMGVSAAADRAYRDLIADEAWHLRVHGYADLGWYEAERAAQGPDVVAEDTRYALVGVKIYADGALGSRGAALLQPYADQPGHRGLFQHDRAALTRLCGEAIARGWQPAVHAIGDAANAAVLDAFAAATQRRGAGHRPRIEHAQLIAREDVPRFAALGVIASMQPTHATSDMPWVPARVGPERLGGAYAWRTLLDAGVRLAFGSDFPVEEPNITHGLYAAITRQDAAGNPPEGWLPGQRLTLEQAIAAFTEGAAYAVRREAHLGQIKPGMLADLTCFASDLAAELAQTGPQAVRAARIRATLVRGRVAYEA